MDEGEATRAVKRSMSQGRMGEGFNPPTQIRRPAEAEDVQIPASPSGSDMLEQTDKVGGEGTQGDPGIKDTGETEDEGQYAWEPTEIIEIGSPDGELRRHEDGSQVSEGGEIEKTLDEIGDPVLRNKIELMIQGRDTSTPKKPSRVTFAESTPRRKKEETEDDDFIEYIRCLRQKVLRDESTFKEYESLIRNKECFEEWRKARRSEVIEFEIARMRSLSEGDNSRMINEELGDGSMKDGDLPDEFTRLEVAENRPKAKNRSEERKQRERRRSSHLMPNIDLLRMRTPGEKLLSKLEVEKDARRPTSQITGVGYLGQRIKTGGDENPSSFEPGDDNDDIGERGPGRERRHNRRNESGSEEEESDDGGSDRERQSLMDLSDKEAGVELLRLMKSLSRGSKKKERVERIKADPPEKWDGKGTYDKFENFLFDVNHFFTATQFPEGLRASQMGRYLAGDAKDWFRTMVAPQADKWTVDKIGASLFDYFFPAQLRGQFRKEFETARQGDRPFKHFVQRVKNLAARVPDITERQIIIRIWFGTHQYMRDKWADNGYDPELSELEEIEVAGERYEISEENRRNVRNLGDKGLKAAVMTSRGASVGLGSRPAYMRPMERQISSQSTRPIAPRGRGNWMARRRIQGQTRRFGANAVSPMRPMGNSARGGKPRSLTEEERLERLRAEGKCYLCQEKGHIARDCRQKQFAKPIQRGANRISAGNVRIEFVEKLAREEAELRANAVRIDLGAIQREEDSDDEDLPDLLTDSDMDEEDPEVSSARRMVETMKSEQRLYYTRVLDTIYEMHEQKERETMAEELLRRVHGMTVEQVVACASFTWQEGRKEVRLEDHLEDEVYHTCFDEISESESVKSEGTYERAMRASKKRLEQFAEEVNEWELREKADRERKEFRGMMNSPDEHVENIELFDCMDDSDEARAAAQAYTEAHREIYGRKTPPSSVDDDYIERIEKLTRLPTTSEMGSASEGLTPPSDLEEDAPRQWEPGPVERWIMNKTEIFEPILLEIMPPRDGGG